MSEVPQHLAALESANRIRLARAELKRQIKSGDCSIFDAFVREEAQTMTVMDVLRAQHRWGRNRALRMLNACGITEQRTVGKLTQRQREWLMADLRLADERAQKRAERGYT